MKTTAHSVIWGDNDILLIVKNTSQSVKTPLFVVLQDRSDEPYAVYLHIYGGGFNSGANWAYPGHFLAAHGIISVVPNYRLNVFGE